jgi:hypothetical protein
MEQHQYEALRQDIHEIKSAIMGNPITKDGGLVKRVSDLETCSRNHGRFINRLKWSGGILVSIASLIGYLFDKFIELFKHH